MSKIINVHNLLRLTPRLPRSFHITYLRWQGFAILESNEAILRKHVLVLLKQISTTQLLLNLAQIRSANYCYVKLFLHSFQEILFYIGTNRLRKASISSKCINTKLHPNR